MSQELGKKPRKGGEVEVKRVQNFNTAMVKVLSCSVVSDSL